jgi:hypothetical protein
MDGRPIEASGARGEKFAKNVIDGRVATGMVDALLTPVVRRRIY